ncbi:MAG: hypothetical protein EOM04_00835 [Clostridia bacterium]|nr:hypothetical protein [Clostridia bacterium]
MSYSSKVVENVKKHPELTIIDAQKLYIEKFQNISEQAFYKAVSRMAKNGEIERISKGIYCIPKKGRFGTIVSGDKDILDHYLGVNRNKGIVVGYSMYNRSGLTTQISKVIEVYSNNLTQDRKKINNVLINRVDIKFDHPTIKTIELLEVLENHKKIQDLNKKILKKFIEKNINFYDENILRKVLQSIRYKKSTIASLRNVLNFYNIENNLNQYLRGTSKYDALKMEDLHDFTS